MSSNNIDWNDVIKKEARGINDEDLGKVQDIQGNYVIVKRGLINKEQFYFPKDEAESYNGNVLRFRFSEQDLGQYQDEPSSSEGMQEQETNQQETETDDENIQLTEERLDVSKESQEYQATITKKPVKETKTVEVELNREEIESIERRSPSDKSQAEASEPIQSPEEIKISLRREEPEVTKRPYVKEEAVVKKKIVTDKKKITDEVTSEELNSSNIDK